jgi:Zn-dependent protease with chaperone function
MVVGSYGLAWSLAALDVAFAARHLRRNAAAAWTDRARLAYPARSVNLMNAVLLPLSLGAAVFFGLAPGLGLSPGPWAVFCGTAAMLGVLVVGDSLERRLCRACDATRESRRRFALRWCLVLPFLLTLALVLALLPSRWGGQAIVSLGLGAALLTFQIAGGWLWMMRHLGLARPASSRLTGVVARAVERVGTIPRGVFEVHSTNANALALPVPKFLAFTDPILAILDDEELAAVTAHELGHLNEPWAARIMRVSFAYVLLFALAGIPLAGSYGPAAGLAPLALLLVAVIVWKRVARRMEERSDHIGREHEETTGVYARALEKIYEQNLMPAVLRGKRHPHPHLYDRLIAAGLKPAYPRPEPPRAGKALALFTFALLVAFVALLYSRAAGEWSIDDSPESDATPRDRFRFDARLGHCGHAAWMAVARGPSLADSSTACPQT